MAPQEFMIALSVSALLAPYLYQCGLLFFLMPEFIERLFAVQYNQ